MGVHAGDGFRYSRAGWPRVAATFDYRSPLHFEDEFEIVVRLNEITRSTIQYGFAFTCGGTAIGAGTLTAACASRSDGRMRAKEVSADIVARLRAAAGQTP